MPGADGGLGKKAEAKIREWLDHPESGYSFDRIPDQMSGRYLVSRNICDFICFKSPYMYYIESKATWHDRWDFASLTEMQYDGLLKKSRIENVYGLVIVLFGTYKRAFIIKIDDIDKARADGVKSLNIHKVAAWKVPYVEIPTAESRKVLLDYTGDFEQLVDSIR